MLDTTSRFTPTVTENTSGPQNIICYVKKKIDQIVCIPDLLRTSQRRYSNGFFDLVREPILQGTGIQIGYAPENRFPNKLLPGFDAEKFRMLANVQIGQKDHQQQIAKNYFSLSESAENYFFQYVPENSLLLTMEIPPWLANGCKSRGINFIDFAISPLRFGRDLYAALRTSDEIIFQRLHSQRVLDEEIRLEASTLAANMQMHKLHLQEIQNIHLQNLDDGLLFIGQAPSDASLLSPNGSSLCCDDFASEILSLSRGKKLFYKGHPYAPEASEEEKRRLEIITGQTPENCLLNAYQILTSHDEIELVGISSGMLQEAVCFGKKAHTLFQPYVPLTTSKNIEANQYQQFHFQKLLAPIFWHSVLTPEHKIPALAQLPTLSHNYSREVLDLWWDYSKVMTWERKLPYESFMRNGGAVFRQRIEFLEQKFSQGTGKISQEGHDFSLNSGERQIATRYEEIRADHRYRYEWVDARLPRDVYGVDAFCGNGYGTGHLSKTRHVLGIDGSIDAISLASQHYQTHNALFSQAFYPFTLPKDSFDFAVSLESVEHVEKGDDFFSMLVNSLKPGGLLFFSVPCETHLPHAKLSDIFHFHHKHYSFEEAKHMIDANELELLEWAGQDVYSFTAQGKPIPLTDPKLMKLEKNSIRQFIIFSCRKKITPSDFD